MAPLVPLSPVEFPAEAACAAPTAQIFRSCRRALRPVFAVLDYHRANGSLAPFTRGERRARRERMAKVGAPPHGRIVNLLYVDYSRATDIAVLRNGCAPEDASTSN